MYIGKINILENGICTAVYILYSTHSMVLMFIFVTGQIILSPFAASVVDHFCNKLTQIFAKIFSCKFQKTSLFLSSFNLVQVTVKTKKIK